MGVRRIHTVDRWITTAAFLCCILAAGCATTGDRSGTAQPEVAPRTLDEPVAEGIFAPAVRPSCPGVSTVRANVVALDQPIVLNRSGATIPGGMIFALARDVVSSDGKSCWFEKGSKTSCKPICRSP